MRKDLERESQGARLVKQVSDNALRSGDGYSGGARGALFSAVSDEKSRCRRSRRDVHVFRMRMPRSGDADNSNASRGAVTRY